MSEKNAEMKNSEKKNAGVLDPASGIRNHFSKTIVDTLKSAWAFLVIGVLNVTGQVAGSIGDKLDSLGDSTAGTKMMIIVPIAVLVFVLVIFLFNFFRWRKTYITIDDENLTVNNNYLFQKKVTTIRLKSIATVNFQQGIPERIFGTYKLQVDINSSVTANSTDFNLVFDKETAQEVKSILTEKSLGKTVAAANATDLLERADGTLEASDSQNVQTPQEEKKLIYQFKTSQVVRHCVLCLSLMILLITAGSVTGSVIGLVTSDTEGIAFVLPMLLILVPMLWSQVSPFFTYYGFKIEKIGDRAVVSYGFFTHRQYNLPLTKTNAIIVHQPLFARIFGYYYGELINVGMGDEDNNGIPIFCLAVKQDEMRRIISELRPDLQIGGLGESSPDSSYLPVCVPYFILGAIAVIVSACLDYWWIGVIALVLLMLVAILSYKTKSLAVLSDKAIITSGVFHKRTTVVPNAKIQNVEAKSGPISKRLGLAHGSVTVLAAALYSEQEIGYFPKERFDNLFNNVVGVDD